MTQTKTVLFISLNSPGHVNSALGIADELKKKHSFRTVFLLLGDPIGNTVREHGHELLIIEESKVYEDYPIEEGEDPSQPIDEELRKERGISKRKFPGAFKWPQAILRYRNYFRLPPLEAFLGTAQIMEQLMATELADNHESYIAAIKSVNPDLVVIDSYYIPPCVVGLKHIPWVKLFSANPFGLVKSKLPGGVRPPPMTGEPLFNKQIREKMRLEDPKKWEAIVDNWKLTGGKFKEVMSKCGKPLDKMFEEYGCPPLEHGEQAHDSPYLNIYLFPKDIDYDQDDDLFYYKPRWFRANILIRNKLAQINPKDAEFWTEKLNEGLKNKNGMIYFSLGSLASGDFQLMKKYTQMLKTDTKRLYVVSKGVNGDKFELNDENMIGGNFIPQNLFLEQADLAIVHGGNNSLAECMYFGVPMIVLPMFGDQHDNAQRIEDLNLGKALNCFECTEEALHKAIEDILSDKQLIERCRDIGKRMRADNDMAKISLMVKKLIEEKQLDENFIDECRVKRADQIQW